MSDELFGHSANRRGRRHALADHLRDTAALTRHFADPFGTGELAGYLGLVHDVGKGYCAWQKGLCRAELTGGRVGIDHKAAGVHLAARVMPWQFSGVIEGHHGGLPAKEDLRLLVRGLQKDLPAYVDEAITNVSAVVPEVLRTAPVALPDWVTGGSVADLELLIRMTYSALVDADFLDTAAHFAGRPVRVRANADMDALADRFEQRRKASLARRRSTPLDAVREDIYQQALLAAERDPDIYRLHIPTGGGKTYAAAGFALRHAQKHGHRRVIVAVPFVSITEQNAADYRQMLDPERGLPDVLEHHSSADLGHGWARLAAENWDAPFVITTTVQLFESLFARTPSRMRKLHRLAGSVIVLDEVQALPDHLLVPILSALRTLVEHFDVTVLLSSATQPEFWTINAFAGLPQRSVIDDPGPLFNTLRRVHYEWRRGVTLAGIAADAARHRQVLMIVNTTKDANAVHRALGHRAFHLSTRMTAGHRRETIEKIKEQLADGHDVQVVSTSLIEAGVDLDFPRVYRAWTLPESIQQAAGRCNRNGRLPFGITVVFSATDAGQPFSDEYRRALGEARGRFGPRAADPDDLGALAAYYKARYRSRAGASIADSTGGLGEPIEKLRTNLNFPAVAEEFKMIDDRMATVVVIRPDLPPDEREAVRAAVELLRSGEPAGPETLRLLQPHTASIPRKEADAALLEGHAGTIAGDLIEWTGPYHPQRGIEPPA